MLYVIELIKLLEKCAPLKIVTFKDIEFGWHIPVARIEENEYEVLLDCE